MPDSIEGKYVLVESENFDEYLKVCDVGFFIRTIMKSATPTIEIYRDGEWWVIKTIVPFKTVEHRFKSGEEFEMDIPDGMKTILTQHMVVLIRHDIHALWNFSYPF
jgi:hypothetical protein